MFFFYQIKQKIVDLFKDKDFLVFLLYIGLFFVLLFSTRNGVGQYWDWSFPFFKDQVPNFFLHSSSSWIPQNFGMPMMYSSDIFFRFLIYLLSFLKFHPETLLFIVNILIFSVGSFGVYLISKRKTSFTLAIILGIASFVNPAIFYKFIAGHINYLVSYVIFIYIVYYLFFYYKNTIRDSIILGLLFAFVGVQLQFFVITSIFFLIYVSLNREKFSFRNLLLVGSMVVLINSFWLFNYLFSINSISETIHSGISKGFASISEASYLNIFSLSFAKATFITAYFTKFQLFLSSLFFMFPLIYLFIYKKRNKDLINILLFLIILIYLATGDSRSIPITTISNVMGSLFREVGHFAPIIFLMALLSICFTISKKYILNFIFGVYLVFFCLMIGIIYTKSYSLVNFESIREKFEPFHEVNKSDTSTYRILNYPFWGQYGIKDITQRTTSDGLLLNNTGWDSFSLFSGKENVSNPSTPEGSLQYDLLKTYDITNFKKYNIKYIYDFSSTYESFMDKYISSSMYDNDISIIKNDSNFLSKLIAENPGALEKVNDKILRVKDVVPRIFAIDSLFFISADNVSKETEQFATNIIGDNFYYTSDVSALSDIDSSPFNYIFSLFNNPADLTLRNNRIIYQNSFLDKASKALDTLYFGYLDPKASISINEVPIALSVEKNKTAVSAQNNTFNSLPVKLKEGQNTFSYSTLKEDNLNVIENPSFEDRPWRDEVFDCFNHDAYPEIDMSINKTKSTDGKHSLQLEATKHVACTWTTILLESDSKYLFSFDYQTDNIGSYMGFMLFKEGTYISLADSKTQIFDTDWHAHSQVVKVPVDVSQAKLYLYSYFSDQKTNNIIRYDNFKLTKIPNISENMFLYGKSDIKLEKPKLITFETVNPAHKNIDISGATLPFFLVMSDSYHPGWLIKPRNSKNTNFSNANPSLYFLDKLNSQYHFSLNDSLNVWYFEPEQFCKEFSTACRKNNDNSYDIELIAQFWPQRWFNVGVGISGFILFLSIGYLFKKRKKVEKTYEN